MEDIARELRRSRPVVYRYFSDKGDLFRAVAGDLMQTAIADARSGAEAATSTADRVVAVLEAKLALAVRVYADSPHHARDLLAQDTGLVADQAAEYIDELARLVTGALSAELDVDTAAERAAILIALTRGLEDDMSDLDLTRSRLRLAVDLVCAHDGNAASGRETRTRNA